MLFLAIWKYVVLLRIENVACVVVIKLGLLFGRHHSLHSTV